MIEIHNLKEFKEKIDFCSLPYELAKDIVFQLYVFETEFDYAYSTSNRVIILKENEKADLSNLMCESEEEIAGYLKQTYIVSDYGEGVIVYRKSV